MISNKSRRPSHEAFRDNLAAEARQMSKQGYLTAHEAAERSGRGLATIYRWCRGKDPVLKTKTTGIKGTLQRRWVSKSSLKAATTGSRR